MRKRERESERERKKEGFCLGIESDFLTEHHVRHPGLEREGEKLELIAETYLGL